MRKTNIEKKLAVLLVAAMTVSMAGCGKQEDDKTTPTPTPGDNAGATPKPTEEATPEPTPEDLGAYAIRTDKDGNKIDLGGISVIVSNWGATNQEQSDEALSAYDEARRDYLEWAQETYHFTYEEKAISTWESTPEDFVNYATSGGDDNYYIFALRTGDELIAALKNGLLYDVSTLDCFDFSEPKWVQGILNQYSKNGGVYGFRTDKNGMLGGRGVYFNKRILSDIGYDPDQLYKWQDAGEWTWEKFEEICAKAEADTDNDGVADRFAMASMNAIWYKMAVYSNGGSFIALDESGKYINNSENSKTMEALNWGQRMWNTYDAHKSYPEDAEWNYFETLFPEGKACFWAAEMWRAGSLNENMKDDFGYICFPKGPGAEDYVNVCSDNPYVIPACYDAEKAWKIAFAWDVMTEPIPGFEDYIVWRGDALNSFRDTESVDSTVVKLMANGQPSYDAMIPGIDDTQFIYEINESNTPAQVAESIKNTWQALLDEANQ